MAPGPISDRPSLTVYTASASAPVVLGAYNSAIYTIAYGINDLGAVSGVSSAWSVLWQTGASPSPASTTALLAAVGVGRDINNTGQIAGYRGFEATLLTPDGAGGYIVTAFGLAGASASEAAGLNDNGQVVGYSRFEVPNGYVLKCFLWTPIADNATTGSIEEFPGLGETLCAAADINEAGQITGNSYTAGGISHAFVRSGGATIDLQPGTEFSYGTAINNAGQVAGFREGGAPRTATVWSPSESGWTTASDLIVPPLSGQSGGIGSLALDINDAGFVVGYSADEHGVLRAFFWQGSTVTELTNPNSTITAAYALTNIVGNVAVVVGFDQAGSNRNGLRWAVSLEPVVEVGYLAQLTQLITDLESGGALDAAEVVSLQAKVEAATRQIAQGKITPAKNVLYAMINWVEALRASGRLTTAEAQALIDAAQALIAEL
jgi:probable HAF family extracellular repeat protein